jgi:hypothetical protein
VNFWVNVQVRSKACIVHTSDCSYKPKISKTKGVGELRAEGGWFSFAAKDEAFAFCHKQEGYNILTCKYCNP